MNTGSIQPMKIYPHSLKAKNFKAYYPIPKAGSVAQQGLVDVLPPGMDKGKEQVQQAQSGHYTSNPIVNPIEKVMSKID
ncbi:MAG: hypothetical protein JW855_05300 [Gammaproteobacteria bacterium]|nr:hypothetical protein [Gammaproteobacteria bacterium]